GGRAVPGGGDPDRPAAGRHRDRRRRRRTRGARTARRESLRRRRSRPGHSRAVGRRRGEANRCLGQRYADPHADGRRSDRRQGDRFCDRRRRLPDQAFRTAGAGPQAAGARAAARVPQAARPRNRRAARRSVPARGLPRRALHPAHTEAVRRARSPGRGRRRGDERRGTARPGVGRECRSVYERGPDYGVGAAQAPGRAVDHRDGTRRRISHRRVGCGGGAREEIVERRRGPSVRLKLTLSYAGFLMLAGVLMFVAAWLAGQPHNPFIAVLRYVPDEVVTAIGRIVPGNRGFLLRAYAPPAAVMLGFLLAFGLVGGWVLAGRMLAPLTRITAATRHAATGSMSQRIRLPGRHDELRQLADDFDAMLARLEAHVAEQRRFAANASHELRTPLTITRTLLEVAREDPDRDVDQLIERLQRINARAIELTEALLLLSRAEARAFERVPVDLSLIAEEVTETLLPLGERRRVSIETSGGAAPSIGSAALLQQMVMNLVHNAIVHNLADGGPVWVVTGGRDGRATLTVENTGEPLAAAVVATL